VSVVKYGLPVPAAKTTTRPFHVADGAPPDERFSDGAHFDGRRDPRVDADVFQRVLQREGVDDGGEHAHVVRRRAIHAACACRQAAKQIATANHDARLYAELLNLLDVPGDLRGDRRIDPKLLFAHQGFSGELQQDTAVG